ncbi:MAG: chlorophyll synthesis pathway protein BchC [Chloroherpetonaceae bacterium]|nr:chlorophyll synthesis pathway protein BchC [Chloroherpetonaceae bacterium]MCS7212493.1 chlorophyll synthesis pathway protein BchC [Chloroherpetonaceae bacterium]MDW8020183.1 chlorophyll synthesis pathway protein BchC [Chloroherpetonaceae bacterium]MDW8465176.1 chlorophyll synthesis pathway protein BchC [Chloroherpetonaceae bacterium]
MKSMAVVFTAPEQLEMREVTLRALEPSDVLVETFWTSVSAGTEKMLYTGRLPKMQMTQYPVIPGYETVGKVIEVGSDVPDGYLGKFVYVSGSFGYTDVNAAFGGASQYIVSPYHKVTRLDVLSDVSLGLALPLAATALHIVDLAHVTDKRILVLGQGAVGLLVVDFARHFHAAYTVATDLSDFRLSKSTADVRVNVTQTALESALGHAEFDALIDCTGVMRAIEESLRFLKMNGVLVLGGYYERIDLAYHFAFMKEIKILPAKQWALGDLERTLSILASGEIDAKRIFTHYSSAWNGLAEAYETALFDNNCLKMVLSWKPE